MNRSLLVLIGMLVTTPVSAQNEPKRIHLIVREQNYHETMAAGGPALVGTVRVGVGELWDEKVTTRIGSILMTCANTEVEDGKVKSAFCSGVMKMIKGSISFSTASSGDDNLAHIHSYIVTGGMGAYENMRGHGFNRYESHPSYQDMYLTR